MLDTLITSKTRIKLLVKFFLNPDSNAYLRSLEAEFGESTNAIRLELNKLEDANLLTSNLEGNRKIYRANESHPLFNNIHSIVRKHLGLDDLVEQVAHRLGNLEKVYLCGDIARGLDTKIIDIILVGDDIDESYLQKLVQKAEKIVSRSINYLVYSNSDSLGNCEEGILLWKKEY
jgi:DNA-binding transcriptional ArsR family regulator